MISRVEEDRDTMGEKQELANEDDRHTLEYQTANELFELMAKNTNFKPKEDGFLTTRDLVLLYKNIDLGTKLMSNANEFKRKTPNQYVETIVYNEDPESDSDVSEIYSSEDLHNVVLINKERIDLLNNPPSLENTLCQKLGDLEIKTSKLNADYDRQLLFKDPYINEQLKSLNLMSCSNGFEDAVLPASLLDYICCKRLEDNYNFYMENIIKYVKHTIEQLKRISNGDYLTDKAKEKWRFVENGTKNDQHENNATVLESSTSIPLHVERKITGHVTTWDDIVHSEVDIRSLSKILEKKIVFEIPKLICGSYRIFSKCCADNLVVSCKKEVQSVLTESKKEESRVDVVFQLTRSESGHVMSNISSVMILQNTSTEQREISPSNVLTLAYNKANTANTFEAQQVKIVELNDRDNLNYLELDDYDNNNLEPKIELKNHTTSQGFDSDIDSTECESSSINAGYKDSSESIRDIICKKRSDRVEASFDLIPSDELRLTMQRLNLQTTLPEESLDDMSVKTTNQKRSITRNRIKSPYENKSFIMEEKKRKRLLEIRQRRERSKIAMNENCKVSKNKNGKGIIKPQASTSVTKLSITNKSFYNSIYGQAGLLNGDHKQSKQKCRKDKKDTSPDISSEPFEGDEVDSIQSPAIRSQKFTNRSYYLDDTVTEIMYMQMKKKNHAKELLSESTSVVSTDFNTNLKILSQLIAPPVSQVDDAGPSIYAPEKFQGLDDILQNIDQNKCVNNNLISSQSSDNLVTMNMPKDIPIHCDKEDSKKSNTSVEFRKSIDRLYDLMNKIGKDEGNETKLSKSKFTAPFTEYFKVNEDRPSSTVQCSDSGTSIQHHLTCSNPSCFSFDKALNVESLKTVNDNEKSEKQSTVVPKVIISTKSQTLKTDGVKVKRELKKSSDSPKSKVGHSNPLKAISQLLHEFDCVQKTRFKPPSALKTPKKPEISDGKTSSRQVSHRRNSRLEQHIKDKEPYVERHTKVYPVKEKRPKLMHPTEFSRLPQTLIISADDKYTHKIAVKKQTADILDEVKESRGEAVRGPPRLNSRLNSLAQPKRSYVQAHVEEFQSRYGRNQITDRLQRMAASMLPTNLENSPGSPNSKHNKNRRNGSDIMPTMPVKQLQTTVPPSEKLIRLRPLSSSSAEAKMEPLVADVSYKQTSCTETPDNIKKKMVAVESYVKNHYGRRRSPTNPSSSEVLRDGHKSRTPLLPSDLELASLSSSPTTEESTAIGSKLHYIIDKMMIPTPPPLTVVAECNETISKHSKDEINDTSLGENLSKEDTLSLISDDEFQDHHISTIVIEKSNDDKDNENVFSNNIENVKLRNDVQLTLQSFNSSNELQKLENALYRRISVSTFQKRLRIKNLTLTPKQSMQQVLLLQSGDVGSVVVKSKISKETKVNKTKSEAESGIKTLPGLPNSLDWGFSNFPIQIATVGYSFPEPHSFPCCSKSKIMSLVEVNSNNANKDLMLIKTAKRRAKSKSTNCNETNQCLKIQQSDLQLGQADQVLDVPESILTSKIIDINHASIPDRKKCGILHGPKTNFQTFESNVEMQDCKIVVESLAERIEISDDMKNNVGNDEKPNAVKKAISVDYTTSLDILAGLLNEIQKITTCQTQIMNTDSDHYYNDERKRDLEMILNEAAALENTIQNNARQVISISSLDKLRQLESNNSIYSLYVSNDGDKDMNDGKIYTSELTSLDVKDTVISEVVTIDDTVEAETADDTVEEVKVSCSKPVFADKGIAVEFPFREFVNNFTDTPSRLQPITVNNGSTVSNSMIGIFSQPSSQSMFSFSENDTLYCNIPLVSQKKIIELQKETNGNHSQCLVASRTVTVLKDTKLSNNDEKHNDNKIFNDTINKNINRQITQISSTQKQAFDKQYYVSSECDPVMKMKRDILVTVYSILVFTVFAALSFPEIMYHV